MAGNLEHRPLGPNRSERENDAQGIELERFPIDQATPPDRKSLWAHTYGPTLGDEVLQTMLQGLDQGAGAMLPGRGERGYALVRGRPIVGTAVAAERGAVAYLWGMYVRPGHQRSGAGSELLAAIARDLDLSLTLEARVLAASLQALTFYRARGFRVIEEETTEIIGGVDLSTLVLRVEVERLRATVI